MKFIVRMITGFFETSPYDLLICKGKLILSPENDPGNITEVGDGDITAVTLIDGKMVKFEISAGDESYKGFLQDRSDLEAVLFQLRENLNATILCEYEGGREHA